MTPVRSHHVNRAIGTLNGNPLAATAGLASLEVLQQPGTYESVRQISKQLRSALQSAATDLSIPGKVTGEGPVFDLVFTETPVKNYGDYIASDRKLQARFLANLRTRGVLKDSKFYVSIVHNQHDVDRTSEAFALALADTVGK